MFYWSYKDIHVVLSDDEETALVQEVGKDPEERIGYRIFPKVRRDIERRIFRYFRESLIADPDAFNRKYVYRYFCDSDAQKMFPVLLDAYGRITRRATIGPYGKRSQLNEICEQFYYETMDDVFQITLLGKSRWPWAPPVASGHIFLPASSIEKVVGTADNFFVASTTVTIKFHRHFVRVSILDMSDRLNDRMDIAEE